MKKTLLTLSLLTGTLLMTSCTAGPDMTTVTTAPTGSPSPQMATALPSATTGMDSMLDGMDNMMDGMTNGMDDATGAPSVTMVPDATGVTSMDKARRVVEQLEDELERLSEVDDAQVILAGNKAAVALEFDDQYRGGVDDRLRGIVKERINSVISGISTIAITTDSAIMDAIESLGEQLDGVSDMTALQQDLDAIIQKINAARA